MHWEIKLVIFSIIDGHLQVFLPNSRLPSINYKAYKSLDELAELLFKKSMGFCPRREYLEQLYTFSEEKKGRIHITVGYFILVSEQSISNLNKEHWMKASLMKKSLQDFAILEYAVQRLRWKIEYTNVVFSLLPKRFTLSELQKAYEVILGKSLDKRNFRKKILSLGLLESTGEKKAVGRARPAEVFEFRERRLKYVEVL